MTGAALPHLAAGSPGGIVTENGGAVVTAGPWTQKKEVVLCWTLWGSSPLWQLRIYTHRWQASICTGAGGVGVPGTLPWHLRPLWLPGHVSSRPFISRQWGTWADPTPNHVALFQLPAPSGVPALLGHCHPRLWGNICRGRRGLHYIQTS